MEAAEATAAESVETWNKVDDSINDVEGKYDEILNLLY